MAPPSRFDDPEFISKFLNVVHCRPLSSVDDVGPGAERASSNLNPESAEIVPISLPIDDKEEIANMGDAARQPVVQQSEPTCSTPSWQSPASPPFPQISSLQDTGSVDLVQDENGFVTEASAPTPVPQEHVLTPEQPNVKAPFRGKHLTPTQHRLLKGKKPGVEHLTEKKLSEMQQQAQGYMDNVVEGFRKVGQPIVSSKQADAQGPESSGVKHDSDSEISSIPFPEMDETPISAEVHHITLKEEKASTAPSTTPVAEGQGNAAQQEKQPLESLPTFGETPIISTLDNMKLSDHGSQEPNTTTNKTVMKDEAVPAAEVSTKELDSPDGGVMVENDPKATDAVCKHTQSPTIVVTANTDTDDSVAGGYMAEDRGNLVRLKTWGTPAARNNPRSRQRTIILSGLPHGADLALVQSFIHGGVVECMRLVSGSSENPSLSAHVTFVSPDACDRYYDKYPDGFDIRHQGKKWPVLVHKRDGVDVVSGMLQGYLECGATRVVKVNNAAEDWGIVALNKLAQGKAATRRVEAIHDTYHNRTRTIIFRFANIDHAVKFKGILMRSDDWEGCHIEFAEDPCAKATDFHHE
ncbi:hypothetical protein A1O7_02065 [Cladophialophora yegresii CBS 114405]|uniref:RRM domain-containing protein n=1 Tax=Cladophialophora yegresii CBS 114405 TaxID=1182544 RepID=W9WAS6_9EURO|nr:uncharacterized protein A1O7_02065 [Cladophialophora yegresii CBS 114405]EXJ61636.1 hypothetical protein A1O7_02065 [Cladophialophora yegresii CBS 114405]